MVRITLLLSISLAVTAPLTVRAQDLEKDFDNSSPAYDRRDVEDRVHEKAMFERLGLKGEKLEEALQMPRLVLAKHSPAKNLWILYFTHEINQDNFGREVQRVVSAYGLKRQTGVNTELHKGLIFFAEETQAREVSQDVMVRRVFQGRRVKRYLAQEHERH